MAEQLTQPQLSQLYDVFRLFDLNGDGCISMEELGAVLKVFGQVCTDIELDETIRQVDGNGNGTIEFEEFVNVIMQAITSSIPNKREEIEEEVRKAFYAFDKDKNGLLSSEELSLVLKSLGEMPSEEDVQDMIKQADMDGDGFIDCNEFLKIMMKDMFF